MLTIRIEFATDDERLALIKTIENDFEIIEEGKIKDSKKAGSKKKLQYLELLKKTL